MKFSSSDPKMVCPRYIRDNFTILHITEHKTTYQIHYCRYVNMYNLIDAYLYRINKTPNHITTTWS